MFNKPKVLKKSDNIYSRQRNFTLYVGIHASEDGDKVQSCIISNSIDISHVLDFMFKLPNEVLQAYWP